MPIKTFGRGKVTLYYAKINKTFGRGKGYFILCENQ